MVYMSLPRSRQIQGMEKCRINIRSSVKMDMIRRSYRSMRLRGMSAIEARYMVFNLLDAGRSGLFVSESFPEGVRF